MPWAAASFHGLLEGVPHLQVHSVLADMTVFYEMLGWTGGLAAAALSSKPLINAVVSSHDRQIKMEGFWDRILRPEELGSYRIVCGGHSTEFADQVRKERLHPMAAAALTALVMPQVCLSLSDQLHIPSFAGLIPFRGAHTLGSLITWLCKGNTSRIPFKNRITGSAQLILPFAGHITNALVEEQLRETQSTRRFRVVKTSADSNKPCELTSKREIKQLRMQKEELLRGCDPEKEHERLDSQIRYEIWSEGEPVIRPHQQSARGHHVVDAVYVVFTRTLGANPVLSIQPLHPLGLAATSLFHSPLETLEGFGEAFGKKAVSALQVDKSIGFEAVLKVQNKSRKSNGDTPRNFRGIPSLNQVKISVLEMPTPILLG